MKFLGQGFQPVRARTGQTDRHRHDQMHYQLHLWVVKTSLMSDM